MPFINQIIFLLQEPSSSGLADQIEQERRMLEWRLRQQQLQSEEDSRWLAEEEGHLVGLIFLY